MEVVAPEPRRARRPPRVGGLSASPHHGRRRRPLRGLPRDRPRREDRCVGELKDYTACFECHGAVEFDVTHSHPLEPLEHCPMCHALHGSSREGLLKAPVKQLCADCHES